MRKISETEALEFMSPHFGKSVSRVWQGNGSTIILEIGSLTDNKGELTIMIEWSWRVEKGSEIAFGSWSDSAEFLSLLASLTGLELKGISFLGRLPEIVVEFTNHTWLCSFSTVEGDPEWALITPDNTLLSTKGSLAFE